MLVVGGWTATAHIATEKLMLVLTNNAPTITLLTQYQLPQLRYFKLKKSLHHTEAQFSHV